MFPWNPSQWTEPYLLSVVGQPESDRLEFKSGKALAKKGDKDKFMRDQLSRGVSAFANSAGGIIVIGMAEDRDSKPRVASHLDGIAIGPGDAIESPEQFQQMVDSCISPFLPGLAVQRVPLSGHLQGRFALVVHVPQGTTAYQARDHLYYSRSEFETKSMPDHEVRLRMQRGRTAHARLVLASCQFITAEQEFQKRLKTRQNLGEDVVRQWLDAPKRGFDEYEFELAVVNAGELTIRDFLLSIRLLSHDEHLIFSSEQIEAFKKAITLKIGIETRFQFLRAADLAMGQHSPRPRKKLFPGDRIRFPEQKLSLRVAAPSTLAADSLMLEWTIFLDDTAPNTGIIYLGAAFREARPAGSGD